jgi:dihydrolipoamide dehydrogenase
MFGGKKADMSYENISTIMFVDPEVAAVGANEQTLQRKKIPYKVATYSYALVSRAIAMGATEGFVKLLVSNDDDMKVLGIFSHSSSPPASS